jgi:eukaryotic-like serine/threonine-protein kinase
MVVDASDEASVPNPNGADANPAANGTTQTGSPDLPPPRTSTPVPIHSPDELPVPAETSTLALPSVATEDADSLPVPPGYEVIGTLGRGGMGVVYRARQVSLNRTVALKVIIGGPHAAPAARARFLAEAEALAGISHQNVVGVFDYGTHLGQPYLALEYCPGGTLADRMAGKPMPPVDAAGLVEAVARAVQAAHQHGVIHRDLKPQNVLFAADRNLKVADFGLAKRSTSDLTATQVIMGTPAYMAPEQAEGKARLVGPETDVWALGAILYECLTGVPPFAGDSAAGILEAVRTHEPAPLRTANRAIPRDLETVCLKCLQKDPGQRYATADALAADLRRFLDGNPVIARPVGRVERAVRWARRNPARAALAVAMAFLAVVVPAAGIAAWNWQRAEHATETMRTANNALDDLHQRDRELLAAMQTAQTRETAAAAALERVAYLHRVELAYRDYQENRLGRARQALAECPEALRGWEWHYVDRICRAGATTEPTGTDGPSAVGPDGKLVAVGGPKNEILVREADTGRVVVRFRTQGVPQKLIFNATGSRLVCGEENGVCECWDLVAKTRLSSGNAGSGRVVDLRSDGALTAGGLTWVTAFETTTGVLRFTSAVNAHPQSVAGDDRLEAVRFAPDQRWVVGQTTAGRNLVWDATTGDPAAAVIPPGFASATDVRPNGSAYLTPRGNGTVHIEFATSKEIATFPHGSTVVAATADWDRRRVATAGMDRQIKLWDLDSGRLLWTRRGFATPVRSLGFQQQTGRLVAAADAVYVLEAFTEPTAGRYEFPVELPAQASQERLVWPARPHAGLCVSAIGSLVLAEPAANDDGGTVTFWSTNPTSKVSAAVPGTPVGLWVAAEGGVALVAVRLPDHTVALNRFDTQTGKQSSAATNIRGYWGGRVVFSRDGRRIAMGDFAVLDRNSRRAGNQPNVTAAVFNADTGEMIFRAPPELQAGVPELGFDGRLLTLALPTGQIRQFACDGPELNRSYQFQSNLVIWDGMDVVTSPDGNRVAVCSSGQVSLCDLGGGTARVRLQAYGARLGRPAFSPNGELIVAAGTDGAEGAGVRVWDVRTGRLVLTLPVEGVARAVGFSADGRHLFALSDFPADRNEKGKTRLTIFDGGADANRGVAGGPK